MRAVMKEQWDQITNENAFYGVLSRDEFEDLNNLDVNKFWETGREDAASLLKLPGLEHTQALSMIEVGCGLGRMTHYFAERFSKVYAFDVSPEMLNKAKSHWGHLQNVEWVLGNGEDLQQVSSGSVDFVFSYWVLQHIPQPGVVLNYVRESARVLKPEGVAFLKFRALPPHDSIVALKFYITTHWPSSVQRPLRKLWDALYGYKGTRAKFSREYESWRGCALRTTAMEKIARESHMEVQHKGSLGRQSSGTLSMYYVFRKVGERV